MPAPPGRGGAPSSSAVAEDDGVLLSAVHDGAAAEYLVVINASSMATIAELRRTSRSAERLLAFGIHGRFFAA